MITVAYDALSATFDTASLTWRSDNARVAETLNWLVDKTAMTLPYARYYVGKHGVDGVDGMAFDALDVLSVQFAVVDSQPPVHRPVPDGAYE